MKTPLIRISEYLTKVQNRLGDTVGDDVKRSVVKRLKSVVDRELKNEAKSDFFVVSFHGSEKRILSGPHGSIKSAETAVKICRNAKIRNAKIVEVRAV
jgi:GGDEF domain-containing protein